jgi:type VI secretion system (T6SS) phospholipase Tle1-like effector
MKHIFVGIDGTRRAAFSDRVHSNVFRLGMALSFKDGKDNTQMFIYGAGVGTMAGTRIFGGAVGEGLNEVILGAYTNIVANYERGDKIYLLGFSRGAVAVRALSGFISTSGLVTQEASNFTQRAWQHYNCERTDWEDVKNQHTHPDVKIEFIGVWDTVVGASILSTMLHQLRFRTLDIARSVKHAVQILAIDELRRYYRHVPWDDLHSNGQTVEQIWLPGVHSDIGGGYQGAFLSTLSLFAMIDKISECCPDISFDCSSINKLFRCVENDRVEVHHEGSFYKPRKVGCHVNQSVHPIMELMRGRRIIFKESPEPYEPLFDATTSNIIVDDELRDHNAQQFHETRFAKDSIHSNGLMEAVRSRLSNCVACYPSRRKVPMENLPLSEWLGERHNDLISKLNGEAMPSGLNFNHSISKSNRFTPYTPEVPDTLPWGERPNERADTSVQSVDSSLSSLAQESLRDDRGGRGGGRPSRLDLGPENTLAGSAASRPQPRLPSVHWGVPAQKLKTVNRRE